jgi:hypothetical protein
VLKNVTVYLVGFSGAGKLTVARELAVPLRARVVDNHWINNPILGLLDNDRVTPFPTAVWDPVDKVRQVVLDTIATLSGLRTSRVRASREAAAGSIEFRLPAQEPHRNK